jgi:hypothetical protein
LRRATPGRGLYEFPAAAMNIAAAFGQNANEV